jgi:hypothetical protein
MYCPKCRTEYTKGFNTCADCEVALVEELPPAGEKALADNNFHPIQDQISKIIEFIRNNQRATWMFSLIVGVIFYFAFGIAKNIWARSTWRLIEDIASLMELGSNLNSFKVVLITIGVNIFTDLPAAIVASLLCAALMIYVLRKQQLLYYLGAVAPFFLLWRWRFWKAPDLGLMISSFVAPFLVAFVYVLTVWLLIKIRLKRIKD